MSILSDIPIIDFKTYFEGAKEAAAAECDKVAYCLHNYGVLIVRDPRVNEKDNEEYIDLMERYYDHVSKPYYRGEKVRDSRPQYHFQVGVTPERTERARNHEKILANMTPENLPRSKFPPDYDAKWRFFWPMGDRPAEKEEQFPRVVPEDFPQWEEKMNKWGNMLLNANFSVAEMAAIGMGLDKETFTSKMKLGPHQLAPTGSDLSRYDVGATFAGFHYDLNFLTIHGRSRFPGLYIWLRDWTKAIVKVPEGCLLLQAGAMFEHITGGYVLSGYHEVIFSEGTKEALEIAKQEIKDGKERTLWRVSSTLFSHLRYDVDLTPIAELGDRINLEEAKTKYPKMTADDKLMEELKATNMVVESRPPEL